MPLVLTTRQLLDLSVEVESLHPLSLRELSTTDISRLTVAQGNRIVPVGELFDVERRGADDDVVFAGDTGRLKRIGEKLAGGRIVVDGPAGMHAGAMMTAGEVVVRSDAADWAGAEMRGGTLRIKGNAGDCLGAGYRGSRKGMRGGEIIVAGNAGNEVGTVLRRGLIAVAGNVGHACGFGMLAGSIVVFGRTAQQLGAGMKRGTIICLAPAAPPDLLPTFRRACDYQPTILRGLLKYVAGHGLPVVRDQLEGTFRRHCGDLLELGKGEILSLLPA